MNEQHIEEGSWYVVLTAELLFDKSINSDQKVLMAMISNAMKKTGHCWASNKYFADALDCSERTVQRNLEVLEDAGYVSRIINIDPETKQVKQRVLIANERKIPPQSHMTNLTGGGDTGDVTPPVRNVAYNNISINNKMNNDSLLTETISPTPSAPEQKPDPAAETQAPVKNPPAEGGTIPPRPAAPPPPDKFYPAEYKAVQNALTGLTGKEVVEKIEAFLAQYPTKWPYPDPYIDLWNIFAHKYRLPKIEIVNETRKRKIAARVKEKAFDFPKILRAANKSPFLTGSETWKFTFDWLIENDNNYVKILEGNYTNA